MCLPHILCACSCPVDCVIALFRACMFVHFGWLSDCLLCGCVFCTQLLVRVVGCGCCMCDYLLFCWLFCVVACCVFFFDCLCVCVSCVFECLVACVCACMLPCYCVVG